MNLIEKETFIQEANEIYENLKAEELLGFAHEKFNKIVFACSFGAEDIVLLDLIMNQKPDMDVIYLDTQLHFNETYQTIDKLEIKYNKKFIQVNPNITLEEQSKLHGEALWEKNSNFCCELRKVVPLSQTLKNYDAWITGIRREQSITRKLAKKIEYDLKFGLIKFNPLADWTTYDIWSYINKHELIYNSLHNQNYPSIGCYPCTKPVVAGESLRAGRWSGNTKTECGLHQ